MLKLFSLQAKQETYTFDMLCEGTMAAACRLVREVGASVVECLTIIELKELDGRKAIDASVFSLLT